jgi:CcmD family protein
MNKAAPVIVGLVFLIFFGLFLGGQVPIAITQDEVLAAVNDAIAEMDIQVDETKVGQAVSKSIEKLEERQKRRLKFLVSAYFMIWLVFSLYVLRIAREQSRLRQRLDQLESHADRSDDRS